MAQFLSKPFGMTPNGEKINEYIISNPGAGGQCAELRLYHQEYLGAHQARAGGCGAGPRHLRRLRQGL